MRLIFKCGLSTLVSKENKQQKWFLTSIFLRSILSSKFFLFIFFVKYLEIFQILLICQWGRQRNASRLRKLPKLSQVHWLFNCWRTLRRGRGVLGGVSEIWFSVAESIEWFLEGHAFSRSDVWFDASPTPSPPPPSSTGGGDTQEYWERETSYWRERWVRGDVQGAESYLQPQESLGLYKSFNTLCSLVLLTYRAGLVFCTGVVVHLLPRSCPVAPDHVIVRVHLSNIPWTPSHRISSFLTLCIYKIYTTCPFSIHSTNTHIQ